MTSANSKKRNNPSYLGSQIVLTSAEHFRYQSITPELNPKSDALKTSPALRYFLKQDSRNDFQRQWLEPALC